MRTTSKRKIKKEKKWKNSNHKRAQMKLNPIRSTNATIIFNKWNTFAYKQNNRNNN